LRKDLERALDAFRGRVAEVLQWKPAETADYLKGFAYGIECQHREESWTPSPKTDTQTIYKVILLHQWEVKELVRRGASSIQLAAFIAKHAITDKGETYAQYFEGMSRGMIHVEDPGKLKGSDPKEKFLKAVQKVCERVEIPLPPRGGARSKRTV
jgi:hypothetical protein